jgi:hypothetical protein
MSTNNDVNTAITDIANSITNNSTNPEVLSLVGIITTLVDNAITDLNAWIAQLISNSSTTFTSVHLKQKLKVLRSRNLVLKDANTTITTDINNVAVNEVNTVLNDIATNSNNPIIAAFIGSIKSIIDAMTINLIDPVINTVMLRFSAKMSTRSIQKQKVTNSVKTRFGDAQTDANTVANNLINGIVTDVANKIDPNVSASIVTTITEIVDSITDYLVDTVINKLKTSKLSKSKPMSSISIQNNLGNTAQKTADDIQIQINNVSNEIIKNIVSKISHPHKLGSSFVQNVESKFNSFSTIVQNDFNSVINTIGNDLNKVEAALVSLWAKFKTVRPKFNLRITRNPNAAKLKFNLTDVSKLPSKFSLRDKMGSIMTQGDLGSCTAFASTKVYQYHCPSFNPSQLFQYQQELLMDGGTLTDDGSTVSTAFASLKKNGVCSDATWPYDISKFKQKPPAIAINEALLNRDLQDGIVGQTLNEIKSCLADPLHQNPLAVGVIIFDSLESEQTLATGIVPLPNVNKDNIIGGHCVPIFSYDDEKQLFGVMNSWGSSVGSNGEFFFPYKYILDSRLTSDLHTMYKTSTTASLKPHKIEIPKGMYKLPNNNSLRPDNLGKRVSTGYKKENEEKVSQSKAPTVPKIHHTQVSRPKIKTK